MYLNYERESECEFYVIDRFFGNVIPSGIIVDGIVIFIKKKIYIAVGIMVPVDIVVLDT